MARADNAVLTREPRRHIAESVAASGRRRMSVAASTAADGQPRGTWGSPGHALVVADGTARCGRLAGGQQATALLIDARFPAFCTVLIQDRASC